MADNDNRPDNQAIFILTDEWRDLLNQVANHNKTTVGDVTAKLAELRTLVATIKAR